VPDEPLLREQAREAIRAGKLPTRRSDRLFGGPGSEQPCAVCGETLPRTEMEIELEFFNPYGATSGIDQFHFHHRCYAAWEFERTKVGQSGHAMDGHERATSLWYRIAGLISRKQKDLAVSIIAGEIRSAQYEALLSAVDRVADPESKKRVLELARVTMRLPK
jgi:hypothetical protein